MQIAALALAIEAKALSTEVKSPTSLIELLLFSHQLANLSVMSAR
jgi:hypothetical protein